MGKIAVIGLNTLEEYTICELLKELDAVSVVCCKNLAEMLERKRGADAFIIGKDVFMSDISYFMLRKNRVVILSDTIHEQEEEPYFICSSLCFDELKKRLFSIVHLICDIEHEDKGLSSREIDVLREIASGKTYKEIADALCISFNTVMTHKKNITAKLGIHSYSGLSLYAIMNGYASLK